MRAALKFIATSIGLLLIAVAVGGLALSARGSGLLKGPVAGRLERVFQGEVDFARLRPAALARGLAIEDLVVHNPPGFKDAAAISCERVLVQPDFTTLFSEHPTFRRVFVEGLRVDLRYKPGEGTNLGQLAKNAARRAEILAETPGARCIVVDKLEVGRAKIKVAGTPLALTVPAFGVEHLSEGQPLPAPKLVVLGLRTLVLETVTLKGLLRPVIDLLKAEFS